MIRVKDTVETLNGRKGVVVSLHWKDKQVEGYSVQMTDDPLYREIYFIPVAHIKV